MAVKFALTLAFMNGTTVIFTHVLQADAPFPIPPKGEKFILHHAGPTGVITDYSGDVESQKIEISSNSASGLSVVLQIVTLTNSVAKDL